MSDLSFAQEDSYVRQHERWNFLANMLDLTFYNLAMSFIYGATVLTLYASYLTDSSVLLGLIPAIQSVFFYVPQLIMSRQAEQLPRKKPLLIKISIMERLPYLFVALSIFFFPQAPNWLAFSILALSLALATGSGGLGSPAWKAMLAKVIRVDRRGRMFGLSNAIGGALGVLGGLLSRRVLANYAYPISFGICFLLCFMGHILSYASLCLNREPAEEIEPSNESARDYWRRLPRILRDDPNFGRYLVSRMLATFGTMGTTFYIVYARDSFQIENAFAADLTMVALISQIALTPAIGWLADHKGNRWVLGISNLFGAIAIICVLLARNTLWFYPAFVFMNAVNCANMISGIAIGMELSPKKDIPTYVALAATIQAGPVLLAPIVGGWLVDRFNYQVAFFTALAFALAGWATMRWWVKEPRFSAVRQGDTEPERADAHGNTALS